MAAGASVPRAATNCMIRPEDIQAEVVVPRPEPSGTSVTIMQKERLPRKSSAKQNRYHAGNQPRATNRAVWASTIYKYYLKNKHNNTIISNV